jgi:hypothetical protein
VLLKKSTAYSRSNAFSWSAVRPKCVSMAEVRPVPGLPRRLPSTRRIELIANRVVQKRGDAAGEEVIVRVGYPAGGPAP